MLITSLAMAIAVPAAEDPSAEPPPTYTVADVIGRNPDEVCMQAYRSGHWSDWLENDAIQHRSRRTQRASMQHYCDGFIHGMKYKEQ